MADSVFHEPGPLPRPPVGEAAEREYIDRTAHWMAEYRDAIFVAAASYSMLRLLCNDDPV